jgi:hypothetical protein
MQTEISSLDFIQLSQGYYRRLMNANKSIRQLRKEKQSTVALNEKRKRYNQCYNLLVKHSTKQVDEQSKTIYFLLLKEYKDE